jgi:hypothetical protein
MAPKIDWNNIRYAPKDGSVFISACFIEGNTFPEVYTTRWSGENWEFLNDADRCWDVQRNIHSWIPMPMDLR